MKISVKIGRDSSNDIVINEPRVSRFHAIITRLDNESFEIKDLGSTNGTFVNGERIKQQLIIPTDKVEVSGCLVNWYDAISRYAKETIIDEKPFAKVRKTIHVGTSAKNELVISSNYITAEHAKISILKNGTYYIQDLGSSNGTFVNGIKVKAKNFTKTDVVKIASEVLPQYWFLQNNLKPHFFKDNKKTFIISLLLIILIPGAVFSYLNRCIWFDCECNLTSQQIYSTGKNSIVYIEHSYFYTLQTGGKTFYIGRNKEFKGTEANTSKENLLPYGEVSGCGCFVKTDGTILTSTIVTHPWVNTEEINKMLSGVVESRTIKHFSLMDNYTVGGETSEIKYLPNGTINNFQNYIVATVSKETVQNRKTPAILQSVKQALPKSAVIANFYFDQKSKNPLHSTATYYYSQVFPLMENGMMKDTFYSARFEKNINTILSAPLNRSLPSLYEGSMVINERGELVGIVQQQQIVFLYPYGKQLIN